MIQFPTNPVVNQEYVYEGKTWIWGGVSWNLKPFQETDPIFNASQAKNITATHISVLNNTSGTNTGDQDLSGLVEKIDYHSLVPDTEIDKLAEYPEFEDLEFSHESLTDKNKEAAFQHVDTTTTKETLAEADKVALWDSLTGEVVLTPKENLGSDNLIFEYIYNANKEVVCSAYNSSTGVFTSIGHGFLTNDKVYFRTKRSVLFPYSVLPDSVNLETTYYVVNVSENSFGLSLTANGTNILFGSTTIDFNNFWIEKDTYKVAVDFGHVYDRIKQVSICVGLNAQAFPMSLGFTNYNNGLAVGEYGGVTYKPTVFSILEMNLYIENGFIYISHNGRIVRAVNKTTNAESVFNNYLVRKETTELGFSGVSIYSPSNGSIYRFYKL